MRPLHLHLRNERQNAALAGSHCLDSHFAIWQRLAFGLPPGEVLTLGEVLDARVTGVQLVNDRPLGHSYPLVNEQLLAHGGRIVRGGYCAQLLLSSSAGKERRLSKRLLLGLLEAHSSLDN